MQHVSGAADLDFVWGVVYESRCVVRDGGLDAESRVVQAACCSFSSSPATGLQQQS
jgi:hypothetical protein